MTTLLVTAASIAALIMGYFALPMLWLLLVALGYFFPSCLAKYDRIMNLLEQERIGLVTFAFAWIYLASLVGIAFNYGAGRAIYWLVQFIF